jgi:predicted phage-related endonuclease
MHQMRVLGCNQAEIVVSFGGNEPRIFRVGWDPALAAAMLEAEAAVWLAVGTGVAPDPDGSEATMVALRAMWESGDPARAIELSASGRDHVAEWGMAAKRRSQAQHVIDRCKTGLMAEMGEATEACIEGEVVVTWRSGVRGRSMRLKGEQ